MTANKSVYDPVTKCKVPQDIDTNMVDNDTTKISMTLTTNSVDWLSERYPDAQSTQEAIRMAISDARQHHIGVRSLHEDDEGNVVISEGVEND